MGILEKVFLAANISSVYIWVWIKIVLLAAEEYEKCNASDHSTFLYLLLSYNH
jgi:hypothetical protein